MIQRLLIGRPRSPVPPSGVARMPVRRLTHLPLPRRSLRGGAVFAILTRRPSATHLPRLEGALRAGRGRTGLHGKIPWPKDPGLAPVGVTQVSRHRALSYFHSSVAPSNGLANYTWYGRQYENRRRQRYQLPRVPHQPDALLHTPSENVTYHLLHVLDILVAGRTAEGETEAVSGQVWGETDGGEDVGRIGRAGATGGAAG